MALKGTPFVLGGVFGAVRAEFAFGLKNGKNGRHLTKPVATGLGSLCRVAPSTLRSRGSQVPNALPARERVLAR